MLYTHGQKMLTRSQLMEIEVPSRDNVSSRWFGVNHGDLANSIVDNVAAMGFGITQEQWYCNPSQSDLFGAVDVDVTNTMFEDSLRIGMPATFSLGVRHSNLGRYAISLAVGGRVTVCSNGLFSGDFMLRHKHLETVNLDDIVRDGVEEYLTQLDSVAAFATGMQQLPLTDRDASYVILQAGDPTTGCMGWRHLQEVFTHWNRPPHPEFEPRNLFSLYNAFTETGKQLTPPSQFQMLKGLKDVMNYFAEEAYGLSGEGVNN